MSSEESFGPAPDRPSADESGPAHPGELAAAGRRPPIRAQTASVHRPNLTGDLTMILANGPEFGSRWRGYDRLQVDNYVHWAETEMISARREVDDLATRYGSCLAELDLLRELSAHSLEGRGLQQVSERIGEMLRLAADEAAALRAAAAARADQILADTGNKAAVLLRQAQETQQTAMAAAETLRAESQTARSEADTALKRAQKEAARLLAEAAAERARLADEAAKELAAAAAAAAQRLAAEEEQARQQRDAMLAAAGREIAEMNQELDDLNGQREQARRCFAQFSVQVTEALSALTEGLPPDIPVIVRGRKHDVREHTITENVVAPAT